MTAPILYWPKLFEGVICISEEDYRRPTGNGGTMFRALKGGGFGTGSGDLGGDGDGGGNGWSSPYGWGDDGNGLGHGWSEGNQ